LARALWHLGASGAGHTLLQQSVALCRQVGDRRNLAHALFHLIGAFREEGDDRGARETLQELAELSFAQQPGAPLFARVAVLGSLGSFAFEGGDYATAQDHYERVLELVREHRYDGGVEACLWMLGNVLYAQGRYAQAGECYEEGLELARLGLKPVSMADRLFQLGLVSLHLDRPGEAHERFLQSLALYRKLGRRPLTAGCLVGLAGAMAAQPEVRAVRAARLLGAAAPFLETYADHWRAIQQADSEGIEATLRARLGETVFEAACAEGRAIALEDWDRALALALQPEGGGTP
jgi:tetratricopeptide (TPR) repeat protein